MGCDGASFAFLCGEDATLTFSLFVVLPMAAIVWVLYFLLFSKFKPKYSYNIQRADEGKGWNGPDAPKSTIGWIRLVLSISDDDFQAAAGLDALTLLIAHRIMIKSLLYSLLIGLLLAGLYIMSALVYDGDKTYPEGGLARLTLTNVVYGDWESWVANWLSTVGLYAVTYLTLKYLRGGWLVILERRQKAMITGAVQDRTVLVLNPAGSCRHTEKELMEIWSELYPKDVLGVQIVRDTGALSKLLKKRDKLIRKVEHLTAQVEEKGREKKGCCGGKTLGAKLDKMAMKLKDVEDDILVEHAKYAPIETGINYFVLFRTYRACNTAKSYSGHGAVGIHKVIAAPAPGDVNYPALEPAAANKFAVQRASVPWLYNLMLMLYLVPIAGVSTLLNAENLTFLDPVFEALGATIKTAIMSVLPQLATIIFMAILPALCMMFTKLTGPPLISVCQADAFRRLMMFYFIWFFLGVTLGSAALALLDKVSEIADKPMDVLQDTGSALGAASVFFMTFIGVQILFALPFKELSRTVPVVKELVLKKIGLQRKDEIKPEPIAYHVVWTKFMYTACLGLCYTAISPVTALFAVVYISLGYLYYARNLLFSYTHASESNGLFFPVFSSWTILFLFTAQLVLFFIQLVNTSPTSAIALVPLLMYTRHKHSSIQKRFVPAMSTLSLMTSIRADVREGLASQLNSVEIDQSAEMAAEERIEIASPQANGTDGSTEPEQPVPPAVGDPAAETQETAASAKSAPVAEAIAAGDPVVLEMDQELLPENQLRKLFREYAQTELVLPEELKDMPVPKREESGKLSRVIPKKKKPKVAPGDA
ncbi:hypothetical protein AB1Y20_007375 [Prymnesium parvum]|uniref:CSC1/OSCA1-like 7TM region domain-containing protein n=1 Tax=Prymnesium parvum TaxID=97485 RepID=A0AB34IV97_PRYPA